ncbi:hypothetical protein E0Z10_g1032 [Xylaria hypoxylon]|uniref:Polymer-forming cytoskeletal protein n=1 Tax=Xylaria hypoxylon TaxID=37992 RepID=A0A4Z0ZDK9_9PEZI|nr:hypothetical protein E0Z10_g1032 [Xylaria hypoxylon]
METVKNYGKHVGVQRSSKRRRSLSTKKRAEEYEGIDRLGQLVANGWSREKNMSANKLFLSGQLIIEGRLHATDKLCLCGDFAVTNKLECEGNFTLQGSVECLDKPALVNNMIIITTGILRGDVVVKTGAYINGNCTVTGTLRVNGTLKINGTLRCKSLNMTGNIQVSGRGSKLIVEDERVVNGVDLAFAQLARSLQEYETSSRREQEVGYLEYLDGWSDIGIS